MPDTRSWTDKRVDEFVGNLLQVGVLLSAITVLTGGALFLFRHGHAPANYHTFRGEPGELRGVTGVVRGALAGRSDALIQLGLLLLIATPVARVVFSIFAFIEQRDRVYVVITLIVLAALLFGLAGASL
jgi:uncharacterized membrane protein